MTARLFCKTGQLAGASFEFTKEATIGKQPGNTIQLYPALISGRHARIFFDEKENAYFIEDLNSRNGTKVDGMRVSGKERLGKLHVITFANTFDFFFQVLDAPVRAEAEPTIPKKPMQQNEQKAKPAAPRADPQAAPATRSQTIYDDGGIFAPSLLDEQAAPSPSSDDKQRTKVGVDITPVPSFVEPSKPPKSVQEGEAAGAFVLVFESLQGKPQAFDLKEGITVVGREAGCTIVVEDPSVSRRHAELVLKGGRLTIKDLGSKNHTYIDEQRIAKEVEVTEGRAITFGLVRARLVRKPIR